MLSPANPSLLAKTSLCGSSIPPSLVATFLCCGFIQPVTSRVRSQGQLGIDVSLYLFIDILLAVGSLRDREHRRDCREIDTMRTIATRYHLGLELLTDFEIKSLCIPYCVFPQSVFPPQCSVLLSSVLPERSGGTSCTYLLSG